MQKNTILGFVLIGLILIGFSWYNSYNYKKQAREAFVKDSLARVEALTNPRVADSLRIADSIRNAALGIETPSQTQPEVKADSLVQADSTAFPAMADSTLAAAQAGDEELFTLENEKLKITFTSKGAQIKEAQIKGFKTYGNDSLYIVKENYSDMSLVFNTMQEVRTSSFNFQAVETTDSSIVFRLPFSGGAYMDFAYHLPKDSYQLNFNIITNGLGSQMSNNASDFDLDWTLRISRFEKGYDNEKNYSTVNFKYPGEKTIEDLGMRKAESQKEIPTKLQWFAFRQQFFSAILMNDDDFSRGSLSYKFLPETDPDSALFDCKAYMQMSYGRGEDVNIPLHFYFGPNLYKVLKSYGNNFEKIIPMGGSIIGWINRVVIVNMFDFLRKFISNYGIIILIMTILIKLVLSPLTYKSYLSSAKMRVLKPEIEKINTKYPRREDALKKQQETMALYRKTGVNMMGGCLP
ncbi:MAG: membrane protein insertase YidC, partial [Bacteroidales bacterium]|nr:membrane protein insertase YidC [Bacteroidales bacterium]